MTKRITLKCSANDGTPLEATFAPDRGMNLTSYKRGSTEVIDQSTSPLFEERCAGLGALIGPHFHHRNPKVTPPVANDSLFPHLAAIKKRGTTEPFSHGIARYVPWQTEATENTVQAIVTGKDEWQGVPLADLEGQDFTITYDATLTSEGLNIRMTVRSDTDSVIGLHYYYNLPKGTGSITSDVRNTCMENGIERELDSKWNLDNQNVLRFDLGDEADYGFRPSKDPCGGTIILDAGDYRLRTRYQTGCAENSWQLYHPKGSSFVCIEPLTAEDPRKPQLTVSILDALLTIET
ncbi:Uncharacterized protein SCG7086_CA_00080 [Chlamydiales bacterium SCGC AG-110-P3]|nr:Uncharacterized protein SCG7086_CA_00080 [Chlamydiales bacterium SCGC AG-110-P3]